MKFRNIKLFVLISLFFSILTGNTAHTDEAVMQAMCDEISRSLKELQVGVLKKPYFIEYRITFKNNHTIQASLGALTQSDNARTSTLSAGVRVGSYKLDNSNFFDFGFSFFGSGDEEEGFKNRQIPFEADYSSLRRELWLATDAAYKQVSEIFTKKEVTLQNRIRRDTTHDFIPLRPEKHYDTTAIPVFDKKLYEDLAKRVSSVFKSYPEIQSNTVSLEYLPETVYYVNSEGREYIKTEYYVGLEIAASTQSDDGMPLANTYSVYAVNPGDLPAADSLEKAASQVAKTLSALIPAKTLEEPYSGPVLFEEQASAELFAQVFAPNLVTQREPLTEQGSQEGERFTAFQSKVGGRVLPEFFSIEATPSKQHFSQVSLLGSYKIDDEGVPAEDVTLVKSGYLKNLLSSRVPTRRIRSSNGHTRGGAAMLSVINLTSDKRQSKSPKELRDKLIKLCKDRELTFGIIVRRIMDQNLLYTTLFRLTMGEYPIPQGQNKIPVIECYKLYPDGREEPVRGCELKGFTVQSFKDIIMAGKKQYVLNYLAPSITSPYVSGGSQYVGATVITPDLLFDDGEIRPLEDDNPKPPILKNPLGEKK